MPLLDDLAALRAAAEAAFQAAADAQALEAARIEFLGTRGKLKQLLSRMSEVPKDDRPAVGKRANEISAAIRSAFDAAKTRVAVGQASLPAHDVVAQASLPAHDVVAQASLPAHDVVAQASVPAQTKQPGMVAPHPTKSYDVLKRERLEKLKKYNDAMFERTKMKDAAWGERFPGATSIADLRKLFGPLKEGEKPSQDETFNPAGPVRLAARVMLRRDQSKKLIFLTVQDMTGQLQVALWNGKLPEEIQDRDNAGLTLLRETLDLWDIVGIEGDLAYTQRGEPTLWATKARILSKCIVPPPDKFHGLHDKELRYRQRYLDLITTPESRKTFVLRAKAVAALRRFLDDRGFLEMETPVLQTIPGGAAARPFKTHLNALGMDMFLRIATEIPLKKLMVGGLERVYELGRIFRNEGVDSRHNPEFTTVEIYQAYGDLRDMMELTETAVSRLGALAFAFHTGRKPEEWDGKVTWRGKPVHLGLRELDEFSCRVRNLPKGSKGWPCVDYCAFLKEHAGVAPDDEKGLDEKLRAKGLDPAGLSLIEKIDGVFGEYCEERLWDACFVINQPVEMSPLCRAHPANPKLADRFEAFAVGMEIANAYTELNDAVDQEERFLLHAGWQLREVADALGEYVGLRPDKGTVDMAKPENKVLCNLLGVCIKHVKSVHSRYKTWLAKAAASGKSGFIHLSQQEIEDICARRLGYFTKGRLWQEVTSDPASFPSEWREASDVLLNGIADGAIRKRLCRIKEEVNDPALLVDEDFCASLDHALPPAGGLGIGIDRVVMLLANADSIRDVIPFPLMRPEGAAPPPAS
jgi:lysyl-tRNA synthetase class 2